MDQLRRAQHSSSVVKMTSRPRRIAIAQPGDRGSQFWRQVRREALAEGNNILAEIALSAICQSIIYDSKVSDDNINASDEIADQINGSR